MARLHARISCIRKDALHKLSSRLVKEHHTVVLEKLNVKGMLANHKLASGIADASFFELRRQVEYKAQRFGAKVVLADQWFPCSKLCGSCGTKNETLTLGQRRWVCACGAGHDRDVNAAKNLESLAVSSTRTVRGEEGSDLCPVVQTKPASVKRKGNVNPLESRIW